VTSEGRTGGGAALSRFAWQENSPVFGSEDRCHDTDLVTDGGFGNWNRTQSRARWCEMGPKRLRVFNLRTASAGVSHEKITCDHGTIPIGLLEPAASGSGPFRDSLRCFQTCPGLIPADVIWPRVRLAEGACDGSAPLLLIDQAMNISSFRLTRRTFNPNRKNARAWDPSCGLSIVLVF